MPKSIIQHLIYGLVDPRSGYVRYIGRSSCGFDLPAAPRKVGRWIGEVRAAGLEVQVRLLDVRATEAELVSAKAIWVNHARGERWPLLNRLHSDRTKRAIAHSLSTRRKGVKITPKKLELQMRLAERITARRALPSRRR